MDEILELKNKLQKISEARKMNAKLQEFLKRRQQKIEAEIYTLQGQQKSDYSIANTSNPTIWGISAKEYSRLVQIFWGKFHNQSNEEQTVSEKKGYRKFLRNEKRIIFLNQFRTARQKSILLENDTYLLTDYRYVIESPIQMRPYGIHDMVRYYVFTKIYGPSYPIQQIYPHISAKAMRRLISSLSRKTTNKEIPNMLLSEIDKIQEYINDTLNNL